MSDAILKAGGCPHRRRGSRAGGALAVIVLLAYAGAASAREQPVFEWARLIDTTNRSTITTSVTVSDIELLPSGAAIAAGGFLINVSFGERQITTDGSYDFFLARYSSSGALEWAIADNWGIPWNNYWDFVSDIALDAQGNIFVVGTQLRSHAGPPSPLGRVGRYGPSGNRLWHSSDSSIAPIRSAGPLGVDSAGRAWVVCGVGDTDPEKGILYFELRRFDIGGAFQTFARLPPPALWHANELAIDRNDQIAIGGTFSGVVRFEASNRTIELTSRGNSDGFLVRYDSVGGLIDADQFGGPENDSIHHLACDEGGFVITTGYTMGVASIGGINLTNPAGAYSPFLTKLDSTGMARWVRQEGVGRISVDHEGNTVVAQSFTGTRVVSGVQVTSRGESDYLLAKYSADGEFRWVETAGGAGSDVPEALAIDGQGSVWIGGSLTGIGTFGSITVGSNAPSQAVVAKLSDATRPRLSIGLSDPLQTDLRLVLVSGYTGRLHRIEQSGDFRSWWTVRMFTNETGSMETLLQTGKYPSPMFIRARVEP